jgi:uncharacterized membrane protein
MTSRAWAAAAALLAAAAASVAEDVHAGDVLEGDVFAVTRKHCVMCHAHAPSHPSFDAPPKQVVLESIEELKAWAPKILEQVVWDRNMPIGNDTGMTEEERALLERWIETLK